MAQNLQPLLVVVSGPPASGKTTLAATLAEHLRVPVLGKDRFKETLYEVLGSGDEIEEKVERAGLALLAAAAEQQLAAGVPVIIESNFDRDEHAVRLRNLAGSYDANIVQIHCAATADEVAERFAERAASGRRHPGHNDQPGDAAEVARLMRSGCWEPLDLPGPLFQADAGDADAVLEWLDRTIAAA